MIPEAMLALPCEVLDADNIPLCVMPLREILWQKLRHRWVAVIVWDKSSLLLGGEDVLDTPFLAPVPAGKAASDIALELVSEERFGSESLKHIGEIDLEAGRYLHIFRLTVASASLFARARPNMEPVEIADLSFFIHRNMLGPIITRLHATISL